jgi:hypothetical protein
MNTSMHWLAIFLILLIFAGLMPLLIWATVAARRRAVANLQRLAQQLGLNFQPPTGWSASLRVTGELRGKPTAVFTYTTGSGKSQQTWAALTVQSANPGDFTFTLQKQGFVTKVMELFGTHEIKVGDAAFDALWFVRTNRPEFFGAALIPELREKLMAAGRASLGGKFELKDGVVKYFEPGTLADARQTARLAAVADVVCDLADVADVSATEGRA